MEKYKELQEYKKVSEHLVRAIRRTDNMAAKDIYLYDVSFYIDESVYDCYIYAVNIDIVIMKDLLGHANTDTLLQTYAHADTISLKQNQ